MDYALKQRLLGAAVLIALAIIFVPMFLGNSPPKEASTIQNLDIPPVPERKFETRTLPVDSNPPVAAPAKPIPPSADKIVTVDTHAPSTFEAPDSPPADKPQPPASAMTPAAKPTAASPAPATNASKPPQPESKPEATAATNPAPSGRFRVNLGIYADAAHADALVAKLKKSGFAAYSEATDYQGKPALRVRVGPFADRAAAESARLRIKQAEPKVPSSVTESAEQAVADAPASAIAANRAGAWAVQLGAFKSEAEANKLRDRVKGISIAAFVDRTGSGEQTLWRVRAGPFVERSGAESARATVKQRLQTEGMIVTQP
jgi:DedD protein